MGRIIKSYQVLRNGAQRKAIIENNGRDWIKKLDKVVSVLVIPPSDCNPSRLEATGESRDVINMEYGW